MSEIATFRSKVEDFLAATGLSASQLGTKALGDPRFVYDLREGREPRTETRKTVLKFIRANRPKRKSQ